MLDNNTAAAMRRAADRGEEAGWEIFMLPGVRWLNCASNFGPDPGQCRRGKRYAKVEKCSFFRKVSSSANKLEIGFMKRANNSRTDPVGTPPGMRGAKSAIATCPSWPHRT